MLTVPTLPDEKIRKVGTGGRGEERQDFLPGL